MIAHLCALACVVMAFAVCPVMPTSALVPSPDIVAVYGHPTVDGKISAGEYTTSYTMDASTASAWVGEVGTSSVTWYFAWDEEGLYYAGTINDTTPSYRDANSHWVGIDCLEISINPGNVLPGDGHAEGLFFSFGATRDGRVIAYRHNYGDGLVTDQIIGKASGHKAGTDGYTIEVMIPWSLMRLDADCTAPGGNGVHLDSTGFAPECGTVFSVLPCAIDADTEGQILAAYKFNDTDFPVRDFLKITLVADPEETATAGETDAGETDTEPGTAEDTEEPVTDGETATAPTDTASQGGESSVDSAVDSSVESTVASTDEDAGKESGGCASAGLTMWPFLAVPAAMLFGRRRRDEGEKGNM